MHVAKTPAAAMCVDLNNKLLLEKKGNKPYKYQEIILISFLISKSCPDLKCMEIKIKIWGFFVESEAL